MLRIILIFPNLSSKPSKSPLWHVLSGFLRKLVKINLLISWQRHRLAGWTGMILYLIMVRLMSISWLMGTNYKELAKGLYSNLYELKLG